MYPSSIPSSSCSSNLSSPFLTPIPLCKSTLASRRRYKVSFPRSSSASLDQPPSDVFGPKRELTGLQPLVNNLSPPLRLVSSALIIAGAISAGYTLGSRLGGNKNAALGGAAVLGVAGGAAAYAFNACVPEVAAANLHNYVAASDDPTALNKDDIEAIAKKYGVSKEDETFNAELCDIYCRFVSSVFPPPNEDLTGTEVDTIIKFKNALGIDDPDAAAMHMEIGRRIFRQRLETGDRDGDQQQRRAFQKLIYVSTLVFGEASTFLLPWKRVFKVSDAQVEVAIRDNAQRLYSSKLKSVGRDINVEQLLGLREAQLLYRLSDELAEDMFREHTRKFVEENISAALHILKSRTRTTKGASQAVEEVNKILALNNLLSTLKDHPDAVRFARGVGPVSLLGGEYDGERKMDDLKLLYRVYVTDSLSSGRMEESKLAALSQLRNIFGLGKREAESIISDVTSKVYRSRLAQAFSGGDLESAESKAAFLQNLCEQLHFDPEKASAIHEDIYRQKLQQCLVDGDLNEEDVAALLRVRVMLCIPQQAVETAHSEICGSLFEKIVGDALASGVTGYDIEQRKTVRKAVQGLRLTREVAMSIASKAVRKMFLVFIKRSRAFTDSKDTVKELQKMIAFNKQVVTNLIADINGEPLHIQEPDEEEEKHSVEEEEGKEEEEEEEDEKGWNSLKSLKKTKAKELGTKKEKLGQTEITLKDDLSERERTNLYKSYLLHCLSGDSDTLPFGIQVQKKKDGAKFLSLNEFGIILGMTPKEIVGVHMNIAEQTFRKKAEVILADGQLTKAKLELLKEKQEEVGLPPEYAQKVIKSITTTNMASTIETAIGQGKFSIKQIRDLKESGVQVDNLISERLRESLFKKTVDEFFSSGTGEFDEEEVYKKIPSDLNINAEKARKVVHDFAKTRASNSLIQAVALLRQRNKKGVVSSLNNLLACDKAVTCKPFSWDLPEELAEIFALYLKSEQAPEKVSRLQYLLGISDSTAAALQEMGDIVLEDAEVEEEKFVF